MVVGVEIGFFRENEDERTAVGDEADEGLGKAGGEGGDFVEDDEVEIM